MGAFELLARRGGEGRLGGGVKFHVTVSGLGVPASAGQAPDGQSEHRKTVSVPPAKAEWHVVKLILPQIMPQKPNDSCMRRP